MDEACEADTRDVPRGAEYPFEVPDRFGTVSTYVSEKLQLNLKRNLRFWIYLIEKTSTVVLVEDAGKAPWLVVKRLHVLDLDEKHVSWLS